MDNDYRNRSPILTMAERMKQLFDNTFLSDVEFRIGEQSVYAHSLMLMASSKVFEQQLAMTLGEPKLILIDDVSYASVYQFVRFIYTDEVIANDDIAIDILKLAKRYQVIKLENAIFGFVSSVGLWLKFYEYCLLENDELHIRRSSATIFKNLKKVLSTKEFLTIHPDVVEEIYKSNFSNATEVEMLSALIRWISNHAKVNKIGIDDQALCYEKFMHLVRFPIMTTDEFFQCTKYHQHLFQDSDYKTIIKSLEDNSVVPGLWNPVQREELNISYTLQSISNSETNFTVSRRMLLKGLRFGKHKDSTVIKIKFTETYCTGETTNQFEMDYIPSDCVSVVLNLGESIILLPKYEYVIEINSYQDAILPMSRKLSRSFSRDKDTEVYINISSNLIRFRNVASNIIDMYFKVLDE